MCFQVDGHFVLRLPKSCVPQVATVQSLTATGEHPVITGPPAMRPCNMLSQQQLRRNDPARESARRSSFAPILPATSYCHATYSVHLFTGEIQVSIVERRSMEKSCTAVTDPRTSRCSPILLLVSPLRSHGQGEDDQRADVIPREVCDHGTSSYK